MHITPQKTVSKYINNWRKLELLLISHLEKCGLNINDYRKKSKDNKIK